jgi:hypothetical protein
MSRFESSRFVRNPLVLNPEVLKKACDSLGWEYNIIGDVLTVHNANQSSNLYGEYALKLNIKTNTVTYNTYYMPNAKQKVSELQEAFNRINAVYAKEALIQEFSKKGFSYRTDFHFRPNEKELFQFFMEGQSTDIDEDEPYAKIKFTILCDGTIVTDSDYLPNDVNERAHDAMDVLETLLGNKRVMTKKDNIPSYYLSKMKPRRNINQDINNKN